MTAAWPHRTLSDVLSVQNGYAFDSKAFGAVGFPLIRIRDLKAGISTETRYGAEFDPRYIVNSGDFLIGMDGEFGCYEWRGEPALLNQRVCRLQGFRETLEPRFLFYGINAHLKAIEEVTGYTTVKHLSSKQIMGIEMPIPPRDEQRRIVDIIDETFEAISTAKTNAEKNLQNAQEVFNSHIEGVLAQSGEGWLDAPIADCFKVRSGDFLPAKMMTAEGGVPVYGGNGIAGSHDASNLSGDQVVIGRVGAKCGNVRHVTGEIWLTDNAFHISNYLRPFAPAFLARLLSFKRLRQTANQAAQPVISYTTIKDVQLSFPVDIDKQRSIAARLDELEEHIEHVKAVYKRKIAALDELKKSLLHQAFTGQLTANKAEDIVEAVA